jgi:hypothetical protein
MLQAQTLAIRIGGSFARHHRLIAGDIFHNSRHSTNNNADQQTAPAGCVGRQARRQSGACPRGRHRDERKGTAPGCSLSAAPPGLSGEPSYVTSAAGIGFGQGQYGATECIRPRAPGPQSGSGASLSLHSREIFQWALCARELFYLFQDKKGAKMSLKKSLATQKSGHERDNNAAAHTKRTRP